MSSRPPVVTVEVSMMELVEVVARAGPEEAIVAQPGADTAVDNDTDIEDGVETEGYGDEGSGVVEGSLHRVHGGAGEGRGVVRLVVQGVEQTVEMFTSIGQMGINRFIDKALF